MVIFHSYVSLPEGNSMFPEFRSFFPWPPWPPWSTMRLHLRAGALSAPRGPSRSVEGILGPLGDRGQ